MGDEHLRVEVGRLVVVYAHVVGYEAAKVDGERVINAVAGEGVGGIIIGARGDATRYGISIIIMYVCVTVCVTATRLHHRRV